MASADAIRFIDRLLSKTDKQIRDILATLPPVIVPTQDDGVVVTNQHRILNFQGDGVVVSDDPSSHRTNISIPGAPVASATTTVISTTGTVSVFPYGTAPANWQTALFDHSAWAFGVTESANISAFYVVVPTSTWIVPTGFNGDNGAVTVQWLARRSFTLPAGDITSATLEINIDDTLGTTAGGVGTDLYVNGHFLAMPARVSPPTQYATISIPLAWLIPGTTNVLAVNCISTGGASALCFRITVAQASAGVDAQYQLYAERGDANGYATLGAGALVPTDELGTGTASGTTFLRGDGQWAAVSTGSIDVAEVDGTPSLTTTTLQLPNGSVSDQGGGVTRYTAPSAPSYVNIQDQKSSGTNGGTFTSGSFQTRVLNTEVSDPDGVASLASNQITLSAGTYECLISCPGFRTDPHQARLQNVTGATTLLLGTSEYNTSAADQAQTRSIIAGRFTVAASQALEVQHRCLTTHATNGLGVGGGWGTEVYTIAEFWKVA